MADDKAKKKAPDAGGRRSPAKGEAAANSSGGRTGTQKSATKRTSAKAPAKKTPAKKAPEKKTPAKKAPAKKTANTPAAKTASTPAPGTATRKGAAKKSAAAKGSGKKSAGQPSAARRASALVVGADEAPWSEAELAEVSGDLDAEASRLRAEIEAAEGDLADLLRDGGDGAGDDQADAGSAAFEREHELSLTRNARDVLGQVEHARHRIEDGSYGSCERCGNPIGKARLQAFPRATLCVSCKQLEERH